MLTPLGTSNKISFELSFAIILSILAHVPSPVFSLLKVEDSFRA